MKLIFALSFILITYINAAAQDSVDTALVTQYNYARELYDQEKYFDAVMEFKRLLFFDKKGKYSYESNLLIAKSYANGGFYKNAEEHFYRASAFSRSPRQLFDVKLEQLKMFLVSRNEQKAMDALSEISYRKEFLNFNDEIIYWGGFTNLFFGRAEAAKNYFYQIDDRDSEYFVHSQFLIQVCDSVLQNQKSVSTAKILSYALPGAGQFYSGEYFSGLLSFAWNAIGIYLTVDAFSSKRDFDGVMLLSLFWYRFYAGNIENTEKFAKNFNTKVLNKWLNYLQFEYKGPKP
ncbi:MAG: hypothetical protein KJ666_05545 [Bacteroidetes bacterium]|nr:hypothetical protein [Bacteroidota bacterium]